MRPLRLLLTVLVTLVAGGGLAVAQDALRGVPAAPEIVTDLDGPLFLLEQMVPGVALDRCVTVHPRGATAQAVLLSGRVRGALTHLVHQEVTAGAAADGVRATRACEGFRPERELWQGTLAGFPGADAPIRDDATLAPDRPRVYRFRVWVGGDAALRLDELAEQDLTWTAELEPDAPPATAPPATATTAQPGTPATRPPVTTAARGPRQAAPAARPASCVAQPGERPSSTFVVDGSRVAFLVGPARRLRADEPLVLRVRDTAGVLRRASYTVDGRHLPAGGDRPWRARLPVAVLRGGGSRVQVRVETASGAVRLRSVLLRPAGCPTVVRATAPSVRPDRLELLLDPGQALRGATVVLPTGVPSARTDVRVATNARVAVVPRNRRLAIGAVPAGARVELTTRVGGAHRAALKAAQCARATVKLRLDPVSGPSQWLLVPLQGRGGGCPR